MTKTLDYTLADFIEMAKGTNSALTQLKFSKTGKSPHIAIICIIGENECAELLPVIDKISDAWNEDLPAERGE